MQMEVMKIECMFISHHSQHKMVIYYLGKVASKKQLKVCELNKRVMNCQLIDSLDQHFIWNSVALKIKWAMLLFCLLSITHNTQLRSIIYSKQVLFLLQKMSIKNHGHWLTQSFWHSSCRPGLFVSFLDSVGKSRVGSKKIQSPVNYLWNTFSNKMSVNFFNIILRYVLFLCCREWMMKVRWGDS